MNPVRTAPTAATITAVAIADADGRFQLSALMAGLTPGHLAMSV